MKLLKFIKLTFITALISFVATSCLDNNTPEDTRYRGYVTILLSEDNPEETIIPKSPVYFLMDDSTMLVPINSEIIKLGDIKNNQRGLLYFYLPESTESTTKSTKEPILIEYIGRYDIPTRDILLTEQIDTIGNNTIEFVGSSYSGGVHGANTFFNILFKYRTGPDLRVYLIEEDLASGSPIEDGYYQLEFRLSGKDDIYYGEVEPRFLSFHLTDKYLKDGIKGLRVSFKDSDSDDPLVKDFPYSTK